MDLVGLVKLKKVRAKIYCELSKICWSPDFLIASIDFYFKTCLSNKALQHT